MPGLDDLFDRFDKFELEGRSKLTPREFARLQDMAPQLVYYYIRNGVLTTEECLCGRRVLDVEASTAALQARQEARRRDISAAKDRHPSSGHS